MSLLKPPAPRCPAWFACPPSLSSSSFDGFSRPSVREIQITIAAVEKEEKSPDSDDDNENHRIANDNGDRESQEGKEVDISWLHSNALEILALRKSNDGWDRRLSSKEVKARIREVEEFERKENEQEQEEKKVDHQHRQEREDQPQAQQVEKERGVAQVASSNSLTIIDEGCKVDPNPAASLRVQPKGARRKNNGGDDNAASDDEMSELSESPVVKPEPPVVKPAVVKVETAEEKKRRVRAEARAKKIEAIADKRHAGGDDEASAISGTSKRHRLRRKKKAVAALTAMEEKSSTPVKVETEAERKRKQRAEARAKKLETLFDERNVGRGDPVDDDISGVTGISRQHRMRRKKSAMAVATKNRERDDWKRNVYVSVLNAEQTRWKTSIFGDVLNAEMTRAKNLEAQRELDDQNAAARRRLENQRRADEKAKKFAARAQRMDQLRHERYGADDDDDDDVSVAGSIVSSASKHRRRRRRGRKSSASFTAGSRRSAVPSVGEEMTVAAPVVLTKEQKQKQAQEQWCSSIYVSALQAEQRQWKNNIYSHIVQAEWSQRKRLETEARIARERAAIEALREKERRDELRAEKAEKMFQDRGADGLENAALYDDDDQSAGTASKTPNSLKKMRERRRESAKRKSLWWKSRKSEKLLDVED